MQSPGVLAALALALLGTTTAAGAATRETPINKVVTLINELKAKLESDRQMEQKSYDKYACWCEKTLERKAKDIADAKALIAELGDTILELTSKTSSGAVDTKQTEKDINTTKAEIAEATAVREKEAEEYQAEKTETEQCIGALEAAINVLNGAGAKKGFLQLEKQAELLSVAAGLRGILEKAAATLDLNFSDEDLQVVRRFTSNPEEVLQHAGGKGAQHTESRALLQVGHNPFGDYAPQSTQIQGILKSMYDAFNNGLEKANGQEADSQKSFEEFLATKTKELKMLEDELQKLKADQAEMVEKLAESKSLLEDTKAQLKADEKFFEETKASCKEKANMWAERSRLQTMELKGIIKALEILTSPDAQKTFTEARTTFLQIFSQERHRQSARARARHIEFSARGDAYDALHELSARYHSLGLAQIAAMVRTGGHFDKVIAMIDEMIATLRAEGQDDIEHRDRCQTEMNHNANEKEDLAVDIEKIKKELERIGNEMATAETEVAQVETEIEDTKKTKTDRLELRNEEQKNFQAALKADVDAAAIIQDAIDALTAFYQENKIPLELVQVQQPAYTIDEDKAPETTWKDGNYRGTKSESGGIIGILQMLKEDTEKEIKTSREEEAEAQKQYEEDLAALEETLEAQTETKLGLEKTLADLQSKKEIDSTTLEEKKKDLQASEFFGESLKKDCAWVETHFDSRREKREKEISGLQEAKDLLAGVEAPPAADTADAAAAAA